MKPEHKKFIRENISEKSIPEIARELGLKERKIKRFLEKEDISAAKASKENAELKREERAAGNKWFKKDKYSRSSEILIFCMIFLMAFAIRFVYLSQIKTNPFFVPFYHGLDDYLYDNWALSIANGNVLGNEIFYGLPLYPYFLGFLYFLFGHNIFIAKTVQIFIGSISCGLVYVIGRKVFNRAIGMIAAIILTFFSMAIFFEGFLVSASLAIFLYLLVVLALLSIADNSTYLKWALAGFLIGLSSLASASILVFLPFAAIWALRFFKGTHRKKIIVSLLVLFSACLAAIAPVTIRNYVVGKDFVPVTAHSGITFYAGNNPMAEGSFNLPRSVGTSVVDSKENARIVAERVAKRKLKPSEISKFWFDQGVMFIKNEPGKYAKLALSKMFLFWNAREIPDILPMTFFKKYSPILKLPLVSFAFISPLALFGIFLCLRTGRKEVVLLLFFVLSIFLSTVIYFVNSRYKLVAVPFISIFSAATIYWLYNRIKEKKFKALVFSAIGIFALGVLMNIKMLEFNLAQSHNNLAIALKRKGMYEEAIAEYQKAIKINPDYDSPYFNLGLLYLERGDYEKAIDNFNEALRINPDFIKAHNKIGIAYIKMGERDKALSHWRRSLALDPEQEDIKRLLGQNR